MSALLTIGYLGIALLCVVPFARAFIALEHIDVGDTTDMAFAAVFGLFGAILWPVVLTVGLIVFKIRNEKERVG